MLEARFRKDYDGEFVVVNTNINLGIKQQTREWVENRVTNQHISDRAAVIGSSVDRNLFNYPHLQRHRGGLQGKRKLQTYASNQIWKDMRLDFYCSTNQYELAELHKKNYQENTVVYTNYNNCFAFPKSFYLIPFQPSMSDRACSVYLAAFGGYQEIYMLGFTQDVTDIDKNWKQQISEVMRAYYSQDFILVGAESNMPTEWRRLSNVRCMGYRKFITHCDI